MAKTLSNFHEQSVDMPFSKKPLWFFGTMNKNLKLIETKIQFEDDNDKVKFEKFQRYNLSDEYKSLK